MTQANGEFNPFDPTGMLKNMRDANMDAWAKVMVDAVNTDAYAETVGACWTPGSRRRHHSAR